MIGGAIMNPYGYQPNAVYQTPCCNTGVGNRGASWVAIALVIFLLLIICCCCCGTFKNNCM